MPKPSMTTIIVKNKIQMFLFFKANHQFKDIKSCPFKCWAALDRYGLDENQERVWMSITLNTNGSMMAFTFSSDKPSTLNVSNRLAVVSPVN